MLFAVFHVFNICQKAYKETCHTTFLNCELVPTMIQDMDKFGKAKKGKAKKIKEWAKKIASNDKLFDWAGEQS